MLLNESLVADKGLVKQRLGGGVEKSLVLGNLPEQLPQGRASALLALLADLVEHLDLCQLQR